MKSAFIITAYPVSEIRISHLKKTIESVKNKGFDIVLSTNCPVTDQEIYSNIDYFIYDKLDIRSFIELGVDDINFNGWFYGNGDFTVTSKFDNAYHFDIYRCIRNGVGLLDSLNYDFFCYVEGDTFLEQDEIDKLIYYRDKMFEENKNMIFVKHYVEEPYTNYFMYQTLLFGGKPSYYIEKCKIPYDLKNWLENYSLHGRSLEINHYEQFEPYSNELLILDKDSFILKESNKSSKHDENFYQNPFYTDDNKPDSFYIFYQNTFKTILKIKIFVDENLYINLDLNPGWYNMRTINVADLLNKKIKQLVTIDDVELLNEEIMMDQKKIDYFKRLKKIKFNR